jgi:hypothetical protein
LADEIFAIPHQVALQPPVLSAIKRRLVSAEVAYWQGSGPGIDEKNVVAFVNLLADRMRLPEHARTTLGQVRTMHTQLLATAPALFGRGIGCSDVQARRSIGSRLSPLQAAHLILALADQKFYNPAYEATPGEWERDGAQLRTRMGRPTAARTIYLTERRSALERAVATSLSQMSIVDGLDLLSDGLRALGLD